MFLFLFRQNRKGEIHQPKSVPSYEVSSACLTSPLLVDITLVSLGGTSALSAFLSDKKV
jgi:hypothetical protein